MVEEGTAVYYVTLGTAITLDADMLRRLGADPADTQNAILREILAENIIDIRHA